MAKGGDVFVLDMGQPVKIIDLAKRMIKLMGEDIKTVENPSGIEISYSGLRPGEKLFEELLIGDTVIGTAHPKIMRAQEELLEHKELSDLLELIEIAISRGDAGGARELLEKAVTGFRPVSPVVDWLIGEYSRQSESFHE
jgi:FlaA1/EpsC-like NDP-sugar epimerase